VRLPQGLPSQEVIVLYFLHGAFGIYGQRDFLHEGSPSYLIKAGAKGRIANRAEIYVWTPGCQLSRFDIPVHAWTDLVEKAAPCVPLPSMTVRGQIRTFDVMRRWNAELSVGYWAGWTCSFGPLGLHKETTFYLIAGCPVGRSVLSRAKVGDGGAFEITYPGLSPGPQPDPTGCQEVDFSLRDEKTGNLVDLEPLEGCLLVTSPPEQTVTLIPRRYRSSVVSSDSPRTK
jgi:hypothetical protein